MLFVESPLYGSWCGVLPTSGVRMLSLILAELYVIVLVLDTVGLSGGSG